MKILCPVDFSTTANNAVEYAARFAQRMEAELFLVHVRLAPSLQNIADINAGFAPDSSTQDIQLTGKLEGYTENVEATFGVKCHQVMINEEGSIEKSLEKYLDESNYDLIIMGTNGAEYANQLYFGTHTYNVIRKTTVPVLMVPWDTTFRELRHVVYATNYQNCDAEAIRQLVDLTKTFDPSIDVLHISKKESEVNKEVYNCVKDVMEKDLDSSKVSFHRLDHKDAASGIDDFMDYEKRDLLVLLTDEYSLLEKIFHDSVTRELSFMADYPVFVFNRKEFEKK